MRYASLGSVSSGTHRSEDLLPAFADALDALLRKQPRSFKRREYRTLIRQARAALRRLEAELDSNEYGVNADDHVNDLQDALGEFTPPYCYFGTHPGDGADFGFWTNDDAIRDAQADDVPVVLDARNALLRECPAKHRGEWFHVNDHGNVTLYVRNARGKSREVWSIV